MLTAQERALERYPVSLPLRYKATSKHGSVYGFGQTRMMSSKDIIFAPGDGLAPGMNAEIAIDWPPRLDDHRLQLVLQVTIIGSQAGVAEARILTYDFRTAGARGGANLQQASLPPRCSGVMPFLPHADFGAPDCCGCLMAIIRGEHANFECDACGAVARTVAFADLQRTLDEMELSLEMCTERCPHCGKVNVFPGFSEMMAYVCQECGRGVEGR